MKRKRCDCCGELKEDILPCEIFHAFDEEPYEILNLCGDCDSNEYIPCDVCSRHMGDKYNDYYTTDEEGVSEFVCEKCWKDPQVQFDYNREPITHFRLLQIH